MTLARIRFALWPAVFLTCALVALGQALLPNRGAYDPLALRWLTAATGLILFAALQPSLPRVARGAEAAIVLVAGLGFAYELMQLVTAFPGTVARPPPEVLNSGLHAVVLAAVVGGAGLAPRAWLGPLQPLLLVAAYLAIGLAVIRTEPSPGIDVFVFQKLGAEALLAGQNPWAMRFPDIYGGHSPYYGEGVSIGGQIQYGFPYPPASLLLSMLGVKLGGDPRYAQLAAIAIAALLIAYARPGRVGRAMAALFLFTPQAFLVIEQSWTEPFAVLALAAITFVALRWPRATPYVLGAFLPLKQYLVLALPLSLLLVPHESTLREKVRWMLKALFVAALLTLPFALWNVREFWRALAEFHLKQPFRYDALSYLVWWANRGNPPPPSWWGFLASALGMALALWRFPRSAFGFAAGVCLTFVLFFAFNKQAFCNYYYFVCGALAVAISAAWAESAERDPQSALAAQPSGARQ